MLELLRHVENGKAVLNILNSTGNAVIELISLDPSGMLRELGNSFNTIVSTSGRNISDLWNIGIGLFEDDAKDAKDLMDAVKKHYANYPDVVNAAEELYKKGLAAKKATDNYRIFDTDIKKIQY